MTQTYIVSVSQPLTFEVEAVDEETARRGVTWLMALSRVRVLAPAGSMKPCFGIPVIEKVETK